MGYNKVNARETHPSMEILGKKPFTIMGIVNVTPDSFYDGGNYSTFDSALTHALKLIKEGADILDIGGESSRPGARSVSINEERERVLPLIKALRNETDIPISTDTTKSIIAQEALLSGATWINDISAGRFDPDMAIVAAKFQCPVVLMHSRKRPVDMQNNPEYKSVVEDVVRELNDSINLFLENGVSRNNIIIDPGIGFAKRFEDNITLLNRLDSLLHLGFPVLIGTSRKSFIGHITGKDASHRLSGTLGSIAASYLHGASFFRVHDVDETKDLLRVLTSIENFK